MLSSTKGCCLQRVVSEERETCYQSQSVAVSDVLLWQRREKHAIKHKMLLSTLSSTTCCDRRERNVLWSTSVVVSNELWQKREKYVIKHTALLPPTSCDRRERNMLSITKRCCFQRVVSEERETCYQAQSVVVSDVLLWQMREKHAIKHKMLLSKLSSTKCCCRRYQAHSAVVPNMFWQRRGTAVIKMRFCCDRANWNTTCGRRKGIPSPSTKKKHNLLWQRRGNTIIKHSVEATEKKSKECCYQITDLLFVMCDPTHPTRHYFDSRRSNRSKRFFTSENKYKSL